jgi:hypothetical protein
MIIYWFEYSYFRSRLSGVLQHMAVWYAPLTKPSSNDIRFLECVHWSLPEEKEMLMLSSLDSLPLYASPCVSESQRYLLLFKQQHICNVRAVSRKKSNNKSGTGNKVSVSDELHVDMVEIGVNNSKLT